MVSVIVVSWLWPARRRSTCKTGGGVPLDANGPSRGILRPFGACPVYRGRSDGGRQVHRALPTLRDSDRLHAWVYQTTRRAIADYYRAPSHAREVSAGAAVDLDPQTADTAADDTDGTALRELSACLKPLISSLGPADQEALRLVEFEGVTQVEAAERLGLSVSGMKSRVQRARLHLRTALDDCCRIALDRRGGVISYEARTDQCGPSECRPKKTSSAQ